jgi:hypothetical protein
MAPKDGIREGNLYILHELHLVYSGGYKVYVQYFFSQAN